MASALFSVSASLSALGVGGAVGRCRSWRLGVAFATRQRVGMDRHQTAPPTEWRDPDTVGEGNESIAPQRGFMTNTIILPATSRSRCVAPTRIHSPPGHFVVFAAAGLRAMSTPPWRIHHPTTETQIHGHPRACRLRRGNQATMGSAASAFSMRGAAGAGFDGERLDAIGPIYLFKLTTPAARLIVGRNKHVRFGDQGRAVRSNTIREPPGSQPTRGMLDQDHAR